MASLSLLVFQYSDAELFLGYLPGIYCLARPPPPHVYTLPHSNIMLEEALLYRFHGQNTIHASERRAGTLLQI